MQIIKTKKIAKNTQKEVKTRYCCFHIRHAFKMDFNQGIFDCVLFDIQNNMLKRRKTKSDKKYFKWSLSCLRIYPNNKRQLSTQNLGVL